MKSLFEYAGYLQDKHLEKGEFLSHLDLLDEAAMEILDGYYSLEEANEQNQTTYNAWGFEIDPSVVYDTVNYVHDTPERNELRPKLFKMMNCSKLK